VLLDAVVALHVVPSQYVVLAPFGGFLHRTGHHVGGGGSIQGERVSARGCGLHPL
jgi:hypothetical protein